MSLSLSHWYPGSGVLLDVLIPDLCTLSYFNKTFPNYYHQKSWRTADWSLSVEWLYVTMDYDAHVRGRMTVMAEWQSELHRPIPWNNTSAVHRGSTLIT